MPLTFQGQHKNIKPMQATEHSNLINEKLLKIGERADIAKGVLEHVQNIRHNQFCKTCVQSICRVQTSVRHFYENREQYTVK